MSVAGRIQLWRERIKKDFDKLPDSNSYVLGDLLLRQMDCGVYHAGVYCGDREVIEFMGSESKRQASSLNMASIREFGVVSKKSVVHFKCKKEIEVYRLKQREKFPQNFPANVKESMEKFIDYHFLNFNCLHFALCLLGVRNWPNNSSGERDAIKMEDF